MNRLLTHASIALLCSFFCLCLASATFAESPTTQPPAETPAAEAPGLEAPRQAPGAADPADWGGPQAAIGKAIDKQNMSTCSDCDSQQNYCTSGGQCNSYCQALVGENGFCMPACGCCVCPEIRPGGGAPEDFPDNCQPVCRCDGVPGPQGACQEGCRQVNCL